MENTHFEVEWSEVRPFALYAPKKQLLPLRWFRAGRIPNQWKFDWRESGPGSHRKQCAMPGPLR